MVVLNREIFNSKIFGNTEVFVCVEAVYFDKVAVPLASEIYFSPRCTHLYLTN